MSLTTFPFFLYFFLPLSLRVLSFSFFKNEKFFVIFQLLYFLSFSGFCYPGMKIGDEQASHSLHCCVELQDTDWHGVVSHGVVIGPATSFFFFLFFFWFFFFVLVCVAIAGMEFLWMDWAFLYLTGFDAKKALFFEVCVLVFLFLFLFFSCQIALHTHTHSHRTDQIRSDILVIYFTFHRQFEDFLFSLDLVGSLWLLELER